MYSRYHSTKTYVACLFLDASLSAYKKMFGSEQFADVGNMDKRIHMTTAAAIENMAKQKVGWKSAKSILLS